MDTSLITRRAFCVAEATLLAVVIAASVWVSRGGEWSPPLLAGILLALAFAGEWFSVEINDGALSASLVAIVLAMSLLGPVAAAACGMAAAVHRSGTRRLGLSQWLTNLMAFAAVPFAGGLMVRGLIEMARSSATPDPRTSVLFALIVFGVFAATLVLNLILVGLDLWTREGSSLRRQAREFIPLLPGELAAGALAAILAIAYTNLGLPVLLGSIALLLIFQRLTAALVRSEQRAEQLEARSRQLVGLQLGVLRTLVRALKMRDPDTGRHASAVAHHCEALAREIDCAEDEQEIVRTAALLHDVGKFTWPDRILHADAVSDEDRAIVESHAQEGSILVGSLDGYGPAADAILYHHERVDGRGYPAGLIGQEIPLPSRILAICCAYDTMTGQGGYRPPMEPGEAMSELRAGATNGQFDAELVERFIAMLVRGDPVTAIMEAQDADFETELEFERRVREMAEPGARGPGARPGESRRPAWLSSLDSLRVHLTQKQ